jgi:type II secretory pathway pseudopilin PulG
MRPRRALTFVDVAVVLVLIALLVALWVPTVGRARERSKRQLCAQRLQVLGSSLAFYRQANGGHDPRTTYVPGAKLDVSNAGAAADDPFGPGGPPANNVPAAVFLLMRVQDLVPGNVICPAAGDRYAPDDLAGGLLTTRSNFSDVRRNLGYSFYDTYTGAGPPGQTGMPLLADRNPGSAAGAFGMVTVGDLNADPVRYRQGNSNNHGKAGQFVLHDDFSVQWYTTPFAGVLVGNYPDNVYTTRRGTIVDTPVDATDAILLPADE